MPKAELNSFLSLSVIVQKCETDNLSAVLGLAAQFTSMLNLFLFTKFYNFLSVFVISSHNGIRSEEWVLLQYVHGKFLNWSFSYLSSCQ